MPDLTPVADGVWLVRGGLPPTMNVYLIEDPGGGVTMFDAGVRSMTKKLSRVTARLGGLNRIVLGHGHPDHRGAAPGLDAPIYCHERNVADATSKAGHSYFKFTRLAPHGFLTLPLLLKMWDGGPVEIAGTIAEGDDVSGFKAVLLEGHAPGQIGLYREKDGVALSSDCFYTLDPQTGLKGRPRLPHRAFNQDEDEARAAVLKLADLDPSAAWPGHADPLLEGVAGTLRGVYSGAKK